ncbi:MAG: gliding motility-associated C-terminal domain-containing protein [Prevotella sp.]|nr:gliding motility-associated C-terminal domain-containing protein [Prevotella sp.]
MNRKLIFLLPLLTFFSLLAQADDTPAVSPTAIYTDSEGEMQETTSIDDGEAPLDVTFRANPTGMGSHVPAYEWHFRKEGADNDFMVRYEENTDYRFVESGSFTITLKVTLDGTVELDSTTITVVISESKLEFPNAFSPNGDGINDVFRAKEGYRSIVEFHAYIFNRWGQKLFDWTDPADGWDGTFKGKDVKDGVYFLQVKARGADGRNYNIRRDINLLRGYIEGTTPSE